MPTPILGAGVCPAGRSPYGFGMPAHADPQHPSVPVSSVWIDPQTQGYMRDSHGNFKPMGDAQQLVYIAISSIQNFPEVIGPDFEETVKTQVFNALLPYVQRNILQVLSVSSIILRHHSITRPQIYLHWRDMASGQEFQQIF